MAGGPRLKGFLQVKEKPGSLGIMACLSRGTWQWENHSLGWGASPVAAPGGLGKGTW